MNSSFKQYILYQASLYQMNDPPETTTSRHCAFHHARPQHVRIRSILERSRNGTPCLTVLSLPRVLNPSRFSSSLNLNDTVFICIVYKFHFIASKYVFKFLCAHPKSGRIVIQLTVAIKWKKKKNRHKL
jgi:hypothetical protein